MKISSQFTAIFLFAVLLVFTACGNDGGPKTITFANADTAGQQVTVTDDSISFNMIYVPGGFTIPTGKVDDDTATVTKAYWTGETVVTYELWETVYNWAVNGTGDAAGEGEYNFANTGSRGGYYNGTSYVVYDSGHETHPVTTVNWRDCIVWCNALTEWYNARNRTSYEIVYTYSSAIIRDSRNTNAEDCDGAAESSTAKGFRLLSGNEYELAARYRGTDTTNTVTGMINSTDFDTMTIKWSKGNSASGDTQAYDAVSPTVGDYSVYNVNSVSSTAAVKSKTVNALGLYDVSGNIWEWCFDLDGSYRMGRGGSWNDDAELMQLGHQETAGPDVTSGFLGFRFARSQ